MAVNQAIIKKLAGYETASWAIWPEGKFGLDLALSHSEELNGKVIFLGINKSTGGIRKTSEPTTPQSHGIFHNFHTPNHRGDLFLKESISKFNSLRGAFMTDYSEVVESDSSKVILEKIPQKLIEQLEILEEKDFSIICFGDKVFNHLLGKSSPEKKNEVKYFNLELAGKNITVYHIYHYSYVVRYKKSDKFLPMLQTISELIEAKHL
ncbi:MAG: hypothetical protein J0L62_17515 [Bacteroidetes bacterium]|nr:hypothetical protein [Bacteroidota bacterium]